MADTLPPLPSGATLIEDRPAPPPAPRTDSSLPPLPSGATLVEEQRPEPEGIVQKALPYVKGTAAASAAGVLAPEIMTGLGLIPSPMSPFLLAGGQIARGGRTAAALMSGGSYLAGQGLKLATPQPEKTLIDIPGIRVTRGEAAEFGGEVLAPGAVSVGKQFITRSPLIRSILTLGEQRGVQTQSTRAAVSELANFRNRVPVNQVLNSERMRISPNDIAAYETVVTKLQQADADTKARIAFEISDAQQRADNILAQYAARADQALRTNRDLAQRIINEGDRRAKEIIDASVADANRKLATRSRAQRAGQVAETTQEQTLQRVGNATTFEADTGSAIQKRINTVVSDEQKALNDDYIRNKNEVTDLVRLKEFKGQGVAQTPAYKAITNYLDKKLNKGAFENAPFKQTVESTLVANLTNIRNSIGGMKPGVNKAGEVVETTGKTPSFQALDDVRRKLGEAYGGKPPEGFEALSKDQAKDLYKLIREAQVEYAGGKDGAFDMLLRDYAEDKALLNALKIPTGKKIIAKDLINPEYFTYDPSGLAKEFFSTRKKVQDLINLTKDAGFVEQQASNHVARQLSGKNAGEVKDFITKNDEWLSLLPNLKARVQDHYAATVRSGSVVPKTGELSKALKTEIKALPEAGRVEAAKVKSEAAKQAADLEKEGRKQAKQLTAEGVAEAKKIKPTIEKITPLIGAGDPIVQIRKLITEGNTEKLRRAAPIILADPAVADAFKQAVRQELSQLDPRTLAGGRTMRGEWETKLRPALEATGLIDAKLAKEVSERLRVAQLVMEPSAASQASLFVLRQLAAGQLGGMFGK
jgi:hypothetical protein